MLLLKWFTSVFNENYQGFTFFMIIRGVARLYGDFQELYINSIGVHVARIQVCMALGSEFWQIRCPDGFIIGFTVEGFRA